MTNDTNFDWRSFAKIHTKKQRYGNKAKIDVYEQVMFDFEVFVDYCWTNKKEGYNNDNKKFFHTNNFNVFLFNVKKNTEFALVYYY